MTISEIPVLEVCMSVNQIAVLQCQIDTTRRSRVRNSAVMLQYAARQRDKFVSGSILPSLIFLMFRVEHFLRVFEKRVLGEILSLTGTG